MQSFFDVGKSICLRRKNRPEAGCEGFRNLVPTRASLGRREVYLKRLLHNLGVSLEIFDPKLVLRRTSPARLWRSEGTFPARPRNQARPKDNENRRPITRKPRSSVAVNAPCLKCPIGIRHEIWSSPKGFAAERMCDRILEITPGLRANLPGVLLSLTHGDVGFLDPRERSRQGRSTPSSRAHLATVGAATPKDRAAFVRLPSRRKTS